MQLKNKIMKKTTLFILLLFLFACNSKGQNNPSWKALERQVSPETPSCADLAWQYPQAGERGARGREFESDPCSCLLLVKNEPRVCFWQVLGSTPCSPPQPCLAHRRQ